MSHFIPPLLLAAADPLEAYDSPSLAPRGPGTLFTTQLRDILLVIGAALIMALILFLWVYLTRKDRQRQSASHRGARIITRVERGATPRHSGRRRRRRRRREHADNLPRNPTLAEAGGLPPPRPEEPDPETTPPPDSTELPPQTQTQ